MTGIGAFLEVLAGAGVTHVFGNPGTTELPLNDALGRDPRFTYVFGLHEIPVTAAADGFAMARGAPAVVNLHTACGLGNATGMLFNASVEGTPLVVTAGQQDTRLRFDEPVLEGDLVGMARPLVKWAAEVQRVEDVSNATRRAVQIATTPPTGPVFLSLPLDVQMTAANGLDTSPPWRAKGYSRAAADDIRHAAAVLSTARNPVILAGSRVTEGRACAELAAVAERLGAPVFAESGTSHGRIPLATDHPLYAGPLPLWSPDVRRVLEPFDAALVVGMNLLRLYIHQEPARPIPEGLRLVQFDSDPRQVGKNFPVEAGAVGDLKSALTDLAAALPAREDAARRIAGRTALREQEQSALRARIAADRDARPMTPLALMGALARILPPNAAVVEEAPTTPHNVFERLGLIRDPAAYFAHRGWALGWGIGCALGVKLAWPDRPVLAILGDGSALYGIQGLWTAARHRLPVLFVVCNNARYKILQVCGDVLRLPGVQGLSAPGLTLGEPAVDFVGLARAFGVEAHRVESPDDLADRARVALAGAGPVLLDVPISG